MQLIVADDHEAMSREAARAIAEVLKRKPGASIVIPTGNTPLQTYRELVQLYKRGEFTTAQLRPFQLDEYLGLPADDSRSFFGWVRRTFLEPLDIPVERLIRLNGETDEPEAACRAYDAAVQQAGGFDLAILGLGSNGHLAFNEPPSDPQSPTRRVALTEASITSDGAYWGGRELVPRYALTCGMTHLLAALQILLLVSGQAKQAILEKTISAPITPEVPASYLQQSPNVVVIADKAAWPQAVPY
ncbi:glucosamine-6-phosphate deaminase [Ktedonosporobacter rubrisoli]|uniref:Glucosamine-6-phosphate deaminase n=1 Tax=Ktedonosporobacter rubrisoli TaxID=2509675 RepID=A0A4P6JME0_KTERU|nr:glucosamine-6-phosphate deaminase [Ktedonosporobacter rubrisoli]QBD76405.1 glucosamine-6-phosphate deaminase [Ktedonosporobacter rubrisoli]